MDVINWWLSWPVWVQDVSVVLIDGSYHGD